MSELSTRKYILNKLEATICVDRAAQHGQAENTFQRIADFWNTYLSGRGISTAPMTGTDVSAMMVLFKIARHAGNTANQDNALDAAGYAVLMGESQIADSGETTI